MSAKGAPKDPYQLSNVIHTCMITRIFLQAVRRCHFDEIFVTGCPISCQNNKFRCTQWWKFLKWRHLRFLDMSRIICREDIANGHGKNLSWKAIWIQIVKIQSGQYPINQQEKVNHQLHFNSTGLCQVLNVSGEIKMRKFETLFYNNSFRHHKGVFMYKFARNALLYRRFSFINTHYLNQWWISGMDN